MRPNIHHTGFRHRLSLRRRLAALGLLVGGLGLLATLAPALAVAPALGLSLAAALLHRV